MAHGKRLSLENQGLRGMVNHKKLCLQRTHGKRLSLENQGLQGVRVFGFESFLKKME
jgi:hypothetical protein